ncbi:hypothetical protein ACFYXS_35855 [Streptomyces sp. NPDC002574]|uniref:hypothetical protein n=1 Tax=Streptomyces sp. NPDC002574 TaxID=3364652 RepID=UPI0036AA2252
MNRYKLTQRVASGSPTQTKERDVQADEYKREGELIHFVCNEAGAAGIHEERVLTVRTDSVVEIEKLGTTPGPSQD